MSRSKKKHAVAKDRGMTTHEYWSTIRHEWKQTLRTNWEDEDIYFRNPKSIINDYNYCDWIYRADKEMSSTARRMNWYTDEEWDEIYKGYLRK